MQENNQRRNPFLFAPTLLLPIILFPGAASLIFSEPFAKENSYWIAALLFLFIFGLPIALFFCLRGGKWIPFCFLPIRRRCLMLSFGVALMMIAQNALIRSLMTDGFFNHRVNTLYGFSFEIGAESTGEILGVLFVFALLPAFLEGILFRGILMYEYRFGGVILSVAFSSVLYAMTGVSFSGFLLCFLNGIALSATAFITGNVFFSVFAHFLVLAFSLFGEKYLLFLSMETETRSVLFFVLLGIWIVSVLCVCDSAEKILRVRGESEDQRPRVLAKRTGFLVFYDMISAPMLWLDVVLFSAFAILHFFL